jgi:hypothetical protein
MFGSTSTNTTGEPDPDHVFTDVFDEVRSKPFVSIDIDPTPFSLLQLLRPEVVRHTHWWAWSGAFCGAGLGFIVANFPGLMLGAVAGNRLGAIRDAKGKSVAAVFSDLGAQQKAEVSHFCPSS